MAIVVCPNTIGNEASGEYTFADRPCFVCEKTVDPKDRPAVESLLAGRRNQLAAFAQRLLAGMGEAVARAWRDPSTRNGLLLRLLAALEDFCRQHIRCDSLGK